MRRFGPPSTVDRIELFLCCNTLLLLKFRTEAASFCIYAGCSFKRPSEVRFAIGPSSRGRFGASLRSRARYTPFFSDPPNPFHHQLPGAIPPTTTCRHPEQLKVLPLPAPATERLVWSRPSVVTCEHHRLAGYPASFILSHT